MTPSQLAQAQLDAYNSHQLEPFLACYAEDVEVRSFPTMDLQLRGRAAMAERYGPVFAKQKIHAKLLGRTAIGNIVIDHEEVTGTGAEPLYAAAIYEVVGDTIARIWFVKDP